MVIVYISDCHCKYIFQSCGPRLEDLKEHVTIGKVSLIFINIKIPVQQFHLRFQSTELS